MLTVWQAAKPHSLPPAPERPRGKVSRHNYSFHVSFWREDLSVILYIFSAPCQWFFSGSTSLRLSPPRPLPHENFIENLSRLRKATFFSPESYVGCFLPHATVINRVTNKPKKTEEWCKIWTWKRRGELQKSRESPSFIGKKNNRLLSLQMRQTGLQGAFPASIPKTSAPAHGHPWLSCAL